VGGNQRTAALWVERDPVELGIHRAVEDQRGAEVGGFRW
jgi:hypothetical protein